MKKTSIKGKKLYVFEAKELIAQKTLDAFLKNSPLLQIS